MTVEVKHEFTSPKGDGSDHSIVQPSDWNAVHTFEITGPALVGRIDSGAGVVTEIPIGAGLTFSDSGALESTIRSLPIGLTLPLAGNYEPPGWLICDGRAISRTTYNVLFSITGDKFGVGDGVTTFNIPDMRGRVPAGKDNLGGTNANRLTNATFPTGAIDVGKTAGTEKHILTAAEVEKHTHILPDNTHRHFVASDGLATADSSPSLAALETVMAVNQGSGVGESAYALNGLPYLSYPANRGNTSESVHTHVIAFDAEDDKNEGHMNLQPTITMNYVIWTGVFPA